MKYRRLITCVALACLGASNVWAQAAPIADSKGNEIKIFSLRNAQAATASKIIAQIYDSHNPFPEADVPRIAVDERTNSLIAIGDRESLETVEAILIRLDEKPSPQPEPNPKRFVSFQLKNMPVSKAAAAVAELGLDTDDARIAEDTASNRLLVLATQETMMRVEELIRTMDVNQVSPPPRNFTIRVVWLVEKGDVLKDDTPLVPDDLQAPVAKLSEKFGLAEMRMVAQMTINGSEGGTYSSTCTSLIGYNFKFSGTLDEHAGRLEVTVSAYSLGSENSPVCELSTAITLRPGHPFILGTTPILHSSSSVFVVELMENSPGDRTE